MNITEYFSDKTGLGVLSTANNKGEVNSALYAKPHIIDPTTVAFIMRDRLTRANLLENPHANYMFVEEENGFHGVRINLSKIEESNDQDRIRELSKRPPSSVEERFLVTFKIEKTLQLVGGEDA